MRISKSELEPVGSLHLAPQVLAYAGLGKGGDDFDVARHLVLGQLSAVAHKRNQLFRTHTTRLLLITGSSQLHPGANLLLELVDRDAERDRLHHARMLQQADLDLARAHVQSTLPPRKKEEISCIITRDKRQRVAVYQSPGRSAAPCVGS